MRNLNNSGMSMMELLVASSISGIILLGIMGISTDMFRAQVTVEASQEVTTLVQEVSGILGNANICTTILAGVNSTEERQVTLGDHIQKDRDYGKVSLTDVKLTNIINIGTDQRRAEIQIAGAKKGDGYGTKTFSQSIGFYYTVNPANEIVNCISAYSNGQDSCEALGGNWTGSNCDFCATLGGTPNTTTGVCELGRTPADNGGGGGNCVPINYEGANLAGFQCGTVNVAAVRVQVRTNWARFARQYPYHGQSQADIDSFFNDVDGIPANMDCEEITYGGEGVERCARNGVSSGIQWYMMRTKSWMNPIDCGSSPGNPNCERCHYSINFTVCVPPP